MICHGYVLETLMKCCVIQSSLAVMKGKNGRWMDSERWLINVGLQIWALLGSHARGIIDNKVSITSRLDWSEVWVMTDSWNCLITQG
jgi:hypothetical protein